MVSGGIEGGWGAQEDKAMKSKVVGEVVPGKVYCVTVTPPAAQEIFFVSSYDTEDPLSPAPDKHGYQRPRMKNRFPEIAKYFKQDNHADLITPIIISVRLNKKAEIERYLKLLASGDLPSLKSEFGMVASIVDGQHREGGLVYASENDPTFQPMIPAMLYFGLSFSDEAELFNTINVTQRKLPKALIETNRGDIINAGEVSYEQKIRRLTFSLCREPDSVWGPVDDREQVNMTGMRDPDKPVTYEGLRRSTSNMFPPTLLSRLARIDEGLPLQLAKRYWLAVSRACEAAWNNEPATREEVDADTREVREVKIQYRIKDLVGVASLAKLGKDIMTSHLESKDENVLEELTAKLADVDWEKRDDNPWMRSQAGFAGQKELYEVLYNYVYNGETPFEASTSNYVMRAA